MESANQISKNERKFLVISVSLAFILTVLSISTKFILAYNHSIRKQQYLLYAEANNKPIGWVSDCFRGNPYSLFFILFAVLILIISLALRRFPFEKYIAGVSFAVFTIWAMFVLFLPNLFVYLTNIEWHSTLITINIFDLILCLIFPVILIAQIKINLRFAKEKFQDKISLR